MCGIGSIDVKDWKQNTVYKGDYHPNHIVIQWFWRVVLSFNNELRSRLLQVRNMAWSLPYSPTVQVTYIYMEVAFHILFKMQPILLQILQLF